MNAIPTVYRGVTYRSRIEARWARWFHELGIPVEYEREGYRRGNVAYLPDFWLPEQDFWVEIKGDTPTSEERHKADVLCIETGKAVFILYGGIPHVPNDPGGCELHLRNSVDRLAVTDTGWKWTECPLCHHITMAYEGRLDRTGHVGECEGPDGGHGHDSPRLMDAYAKARGAKFEHGESTAAERFTRELSERNHHAGIARPVRQTLTQGGRPNAEPVR